MFIYYGTKWIRQLVSTSTFTLLTYEYLNFHSLYRKLKTFYFCIYLLPIPLLEFLL